MRILIVLAALVFFISETLAEECLVPPAFDPGVGELYFCSPQEGERHLIEYARQSFVEEGLGEDTWINFRGVFADQLWINVGTRETSDTSLPTWEVITELIKRMQAINQPCRPFWPP